MRLQSGGATDYGRRSPTSPFRELCVSQQGQTQEFFEAFATGWQTRAAGEEGVFNIIDARHRAVLAILDDVPNARRALDVGCGTGQLLVSIGERGIDGEGIDFAPSMIEHCNQNASGAGLSNLKFTCASFFDVELEDGAYDLISAQGFIEYISLEEIEEFLARCYRALRPGGALALGSRNRLFNALTMNAFTRQELELGILPILVQESVTLATTESNDAAFKALRRLERTDPHPDRHPDTGIHVDTRYQFTPADLASRLRRNGLTASAVFPVNFHALPPVLADEQAGIYNHMAQFASDVWPRDHRLVPFSSSFVIRGDKPA
jgi:2-polyprenyl-3-methyl-5-hydroxy-6-metoxy-1,4-benzoquinol methylase